ncbi:MAG: hypothetical protein M1465_01120 [Candidatus Marsarchaeota archaeon]|jgi:hypothetical protein|nr:hypothetical protein [Candidatus Marsarchaeota archaeon]
MDKSEKHPKMSEYQEDLIKNANVDEESIKKQYIEENGNLYRVPYRIVSKVVFSNVDKSEFKDPEHAARLQYRLMLNDAILKARVHYARGNITIIYNPPSADNLKEKISLDEIVKFLAGEGVHVSGANTANGDYDYYKDFYSYAFNSPSIREHAPYGYTIQEWKKMKPEWERKKAEYREKNEEKFRQFQMDYLKEHPELAKEYGIELQEEKPVSQGLFGRRKKGK